MTPYRQLVESRFHGILSPGKHAPDGVACALEAASVARGRSWSDDPRAAGLPDLRRLNDARWSSDAARTAALIPVVEAYWDWPTWSPARRCVIIDHVIVATVRELVAELPGLSNTIRARCRGVTTRAAARTAARAAFAATAYAASTAAYAAAYAAATAAYAAAAAAYAADAAADAILHRACALWIAAIQ